MSKTINKEEIAKFTAMADEWWDENGKFAPLHKFNPIRIAYILNKIKESGLAKNNSPANPLAGLNIIDIGCGGGLLSVPMARLGANVTAIDAGEKNIEIAKIHAEREGLDINFLCTSAEDLAEQGKKFDIVLNMEVIEHVADVEIFVRASSQLLKPSGLMFIATLNRTVKSYGLAIIGAEYILRWLPRGTHDWKKFLKPSEIEVELTKNSLNIKELQGVSYAPISKKWSLSNDIDINYMILAQNKSTS